MYVRIISRIIDRGGTVGGMVGAELRGAEPDIASLAEEPRRATSSSSSCARARWHKSAQNAGPRPQAFPRPTPQDLRPQALQHAPRPKN